MRATRYEVFMKVVELGSLSAAAAYYNYTQSAVTQIVNALESELGIILVTRNRSGTVLTEEGERLLPYIAEIGNSHSNLAEYIAEMQGLQIGMIRIASFSSVSCHWLPNLISGFQAKYPQIRFDILQGSYKEIETWVFNGIADLGFVSATHIKGLDIITLKKDPLFIIIPESHELANKTMFPLELMGEYPLIYLLEGDASVYHEMFLAHNIEPNIRYRVKDDYTVMAMVENGLGIGILAQLVLCRNPYRIVAKPPDHVYYRNIGVAMKDRQKLSPASRRFLQYMLTNRKEFTELSLPQGNKFAL